MGKASVFGLGLVLLVGALPAFGSLMVDGDFSDWGIVVADNNNSTWNVSGGVTLIGTPMEEDQSDTAGDSGQLGPRQGGQNYDAEFMAVAYEAGRIYLIIVTGQRPDNGFSRFGPGDIRIEGGGVTYGIEVGGGAGGANDPIGFGAPGSTYTLNNNGWTTAVNTADAAQTAGSMWSNVNWLDSPVTSAGQPQFEIDGSSTLVPGSEFAYSGNSVTSQHAVIEASFDASLFSPGTSVSFHWRPSCDNDRLDVQTTVPVPEPTTLGILLAGCLMLRRRK